MDLFSAVFSFGSHVVSTTLEWWSDPLMWLLLAASLLAYYFCPMFRISLIASKVRRATSMKEILVAIEWRWYPYLVAMTWLTGASGWLSHW